MFDRPQQRRGAETNGEDIKFDVEIRNRKIQRQWLLLMTFEVFDLPC